MTMNDKLNAIILLIIAILALFTIQINIVMQQNEEIEKVSVVLDQWRLDETNTGE